MISNKNFISFYIRCPKCRSILNLTIKGFYICSNEECKSIYPIINNIPILINESNSIFRFSDFDKIKKTTLQINKNFFERLFDIITPRLGKNLKAKDNYMKINDILLSEKDLPSVLIIGGSILGEGIEKLNFEKLLIIQTDVSYGPQTEIICDAHNIPFDDETFDCVIVQAVLEHVIDPFRCVNEIYRVLNTNGIVYAETPFIQPMHGKPYDFTRFTYIGHRRLFRSFSEIEAGIVCGPGMALANIYQQFFLSFTKKRLMRAIIRLLTSYTSFFLKYFDTILSKKNVTIDSASGYYFLGKKRFDRLDDRCLVASYLSKSKTV
jgi:SAM-dependent methyltransferase